MPNTKSIFNSPSARIALFESGNGYTQDAYDPYHASIGGDSLKNHFTTWANIDYSLASDAASRHGPPLKNQWSTYKDLMADFHDIAVTDEDSPPKPKHFKDIVQSTKQMEENVHGGVHHSFKGQHVDEKHASAHRMAGFMTTRHAFSAETKTLFAAETATMRQSFDQAKAEIFDAIDAMPLQAEYNSNRTLA